MLKFSKYSLFVLIFVAQSYQALPLPNEDDQQQAKKDWSNTSTLGWTNAPDGRGTIDIIWGCLVTMFLCSWSLLCLQLPAKDDRPVDILWRRAWLTALCALGPEFTLQLALGQWSSARQSCRDFHAAGHKKWTMKHAFYADSGGFVLYTPDFKPIPIDAKQLLWMIEHKFVDYPTLSVEEINDKNKVDFLLRTISVGQILWFSVTVIGRAAQGLFITGLEITTAAFILCSFGTTFCWWHKGADVAVPEQLTTTHTMAEILTGAGSAASGMYHRTPLDFISRDEWHWSLYWTHWINILRRMHINFAPKSLPHDRFENTLWLDIKARGALPAFILTSLLYSGIFLAAWNDHFPTRLEQTLWRLSSLGMTTAVALYFIITAFAYVVCPAIDRYFNNLHSPIIQLHSINPSPQQSAKGNSSEPESAAGSPSSLAAAHLPGIIPQPHKKKQSRLSNLAARLRNNSVSKDPLLSVPLKATIPMYGVGFLYCLSRLSIILLDIVQLRSMPVDAYITVDWASFVPHF
ncbi:hypothetical protein VTL71DRAFT_9637 [Oculimacula yallundae]|uniref:Uncharacterized protein n=1 Tax=Oculimacula yallundae TaxID=86028 RepID=A0ABR4BS98_9HELO